MDVEFDPAKDEENRRKHGVSLRAASDFAMESAWITVDNREDYGEVRYRCVGFLHERLFTFVMTMRGTTVRAISLRKSSGEERREYADNA